MRFLGEFDFFFLFCCSTQTKDLGPDVNLAEVGRMFYVVCLFVNLVKVARMTENYSGSDLKALCVAAAFVPVSELLERERAMGLDPHRRTVNEMGVPLRSLTLRDFEKAKAKVVASVSDDQSSMTELREWNSTFGSDGDRRKNTLPYFL